MKVDRRKTRGVDDSVESTACNFSLKVAYERLHSGMTKSEQIGRPLYTDEDLDETHKGH